MPDENTFDMHDSGEREQFNTGAQRDSQEDKPRLSLLPPAALIRLAWVYTRGAKKYGDNNWQKGMPYSRYLDSFFRHLTSWQLGETDEDHLAQATWNLISILHHEEMGPEGLDDVRNNIDDKNEPEVIAADGRFAALIESDNVGVKVTIPIQMIPDMEQFHSALGKMLGDRRGTL